MIKCACERIWVAEILKKNDLLILVLIMSRSFRYALDMYAGQVGLVNRMSTWAFIPTCENSILSFKCHVVGKTD